MEINQITERILKCAFDVRSALGSELLESAYELTYLKLSECKIGLLLNCNVASLKNGIKRLAN
ncbi:GxxExxY protein [Sunxiuqinia dokdonensis]|uniref:Uncharacterized protein n=1 Tax=Sunxiuqinia dokdonensis TaxID=1409788 RepID=A0A0L8VB66_9BACT|nr:hypothetical protein [Sunxiuqinia dokdonensis]KOH45710.1 hypothetical protein NC99_14750 [Sunxiuqinia dokdonensis]